MEQKEKLQTVTTAMKESLKKQMNSEKEQKVVKSTVDSSEVEEIIQDWPESSKTAVKHTIEKYGLPNEATLSRAVWYNSGPWKRTVVNWEEIPHNFPMPHVDVMEQFINYHVPLDKYDDIAKFDGSVIIERTKGEVSARCDSEAANFVAINLMHEIVTDKMTVDEAKKEYAEAMSAHVLNRKSPYAEKFTFQLPKKSHYDLDETNVSDAMLKETVRKIKEEISGE